MSSKSISIKYWSKIGGINDACNGYINSFGYSLLSIKFLQSIKPPILPIYRIDSDNNIFLFENMNKCNQWHIKRCKDNNNDNSCDRINLGGLLIRFFCSLIYEFNVIFWIIKQKWNIMI